MPGIYAIFVSLFWAVWGIFLSLCALSGQLSVNISVVWTGGIQDALRSILAAMYTQSWSTTSVKIFIVLAAMYTQSWSTTSVKIFIVLAAMYTQSWSTTSVKFFYCVCRYVYSRLIYHFREDFYCAGRYVHPSVIYYFREKFYIVADTNEKIKFLTIENLVLLSIRIFFVD